MRRRRLPEATFDDMALEELAIEADEIDRIYELWEASRTPDGESTQDQPKQPAAGDAAADSEREQQLRLELGDAGYDAMLYATGERNRLVLRTLNDDSPSARAGLETGDELIHYGDWRIYRWEDLKQGGGAEKPEFIPLVVLRQGQLVEIDLPTGWLVVGATWLEQRRPPLLD